MKLRTVFLVSVLALIGGIVATTVLVVGVVINRSARTQVERDLLHARTVFLELHAYRQEKHRYEARVVANEPRLKAVVDSEEADQETVLDVARTLSRDLAADLFLVADADGYLLADVLHPDDTGHDMRQMPVIARALDKGEGSDIWTPPGTIYRVAARRMDFGQRVSGVLVIGHSVSDEGARDAVKQLGSPVVVTLDGAVIAQGGLGETDRAAVAAAVAGVDAMALSPVEITVGGTTYLAQGGQFDDYSGERKLSYVVLRDLDDALAPGRRVTRILLLVVAGAVLAAIVLALLLSRRLSRPMDELVAFTREIAAGKLDSRARVHGMYEVSALGQAMNSMVGELEQSRAQAAEKERLENELQIAERIQTGILPRAVDLEGLEIAARMVPAEEVGGDYYDVIRVDGGGWIGIGDVSGHGLTSGLVMMMIQTGTATLIEAAPAAGPSELLVHLNRVIFDNVQTRLEAQRHATMTLLRYHRDGRLAWAGAHMDIVLLRADAERCEPVRTPGTWLGIVDDIAAVTTDSHLELADGDLVVLYTDGLTEAMRGDGEQLGLERVCELVERHRRTPVTQLQEALLDAAKQWEAAQQDDITVLVMRYRSPT